MKITRNPNPQPLSPEGGRTGQAGRAGGASEGKVSGAAARAKPNPVTPDHARTADNLARIRKNDVSKLMRTNTPPLPPPRDQEIRNLVADSIAEPAKQLPAVLDAKITQLARQVRSGDYDGAADVIVRESRNLPSAQADALLRGTLREICGPRAQAEHVLSDYDDLESQEQLGNMEIQDLMSRYNQAEQLAGSTFKKKDDADNAIINKI